eukprot:TRINITY_DN7951_c0_g1_i4.p3 TRINITY_DN7951_c0_g1~~TRINITY_DN7951_c0_g1_i4.p3  ORF type:complete len:100 (+),score=13.92 TRINITY_DN7951_c0_g1_i4:788-1087(+)
MKQAASQSLSPPMSRGFSIKTSRRPFKVKPSTDLARRARRTCWILWKSFACRSTSPPNWTHGPFGPLPGLRSEAHQGAFGSDKSPNRATPPNPPNSQTP